MIPLTFGPRRLHLLVVVMFFGLQIAAQPIPANDNDIQKVIDQVPPIERFTSSCSKLSCPGIDCNSLQDLHMRVREARMQIRYLYYWLQRAADAQMQHLQSIAGESILASDRATKIQKIVGWQQYITGIASGLLDVSSAGSSFSEIVSHPKLLQEKTYREMADLFDNFYEGMKDVESFVQKLAADRYDKDLPTPVADLMPAFANLTSAQMNDLKSHLSDIKALMQAGAEHGKDWRKILKEGKGLAAIGQIAGRFLKAYAESEIREREKLVEDLLAGIVANNLVQSNSFKDLKRIQARRNKAEDALRLLENLVVINTNAEGGLTRCLMKHSSVCNNVDLGYTSNVRPPAEFDVTSFSFVAEKDRAKSYGSALIYFNARLPQVVNSLKALPVIPQAQANSLKGKKTVFSPGETMTVRFVVSTCTSRESWAAIFPAAHPHGDDLASSSYVLSPKLSINGRTTGDLVYQVPSTEGSYQVRMFDGGSGNEFLIYDFTVGKEKHAMTGLFEQKNKWGRVDTMKIEVTPEGTGAEFSLITKSTTWKPQRMKGVVSGNMILYENEVGCGYGPGGTKVGEFKMIPFRIRFDTKMQTAVVEHHKHTCDSRGKIKVIPQWVNDFGEVLMRMKEN